MTQEKRDYLLEKIEDLLQTTKNKLNRTERDILIVFREAIKAEKPQSEILKRLGELLKIFEP